MNGVFFWLSHRDLNHKTEFKFGRGSSGRNGVEQTIPDINTAPTGITWREMSDIPLEAMISTFDAGDVYPIWIWRHVDAVLNSDEAWIVKDDPCMFNFAFRIDAAGTGSTGGGTGGGGTGGGGTGGGGGGGVPPPAATDYRLVFAGDWGCENATEDVITLINSLNPDLLCSVGDNAYESPPCWISLFQPLKTSMGARFVGAFGNHEYEESGGVGPYKTFFGRPATYFSFTFENIAVFVWDTNIDISEGSAQYNFFLDAMDEASANTTVKWKIAVMHHPWFVDGSRNEANEFNQIEELHQVFVDHGISMVVVGHNHNWQRTHQLGFNAGDPLHAPNIISSTSPYSAQAAGLIHVVTGGGGHDTGTGLYQLPTQPSFQAYQSRLYNGVWIIDASNGGKTFTCYFMNVDNTAFDSFVITTT